MADQEQLALIRSGVAAWNAWRAAHPEITIDLAQADLPGANLLKAQLEGAHLGGADLTGAQLFGAHLAGANLNAARLDDADLGWADLSGASLLGTEVTGADFSCARFDGANVAHIVWDRKRMRGKYHGIRGLDSAYGNALFRRDAADQDYLDTLEVHWHGKPALSLLFKVWGLFDYGRSILRVFLVAALLIFFFGTIYYLVPDMLVLPSCGQDKICPAGFTAYYFSITTYMTLGFGDVYPRTHLGEAVAACEVILGYLTLGLLVAVLAEKAARRS
ncbi:MAG TPA: pentapeptide repeat-containing protein [Stellaceae bacterium]|jgi:hypothetical protein